MRSATSYPSRKAPLGDPIVVVVVEDVLVEVVGMVVLVASTVVDVVATVVEVLPIVVEVVASVVLVLATVVEVVLGTVVLLTGHGFGSHVPAPSSIPFRALHSSGERSSQVKAPIGLSNAPLTEDGTQHWIAAHAAQQLEPVPTVP